MYVVPPFSKRAAVQISRLVSKELKDVQTNNLMPIVGWEVGFDENFVPRPALGLHPVELIPDYLQIECHGVRLAYNLPDRIMEKLHSSILDFDGEQFLFVELEG